MVRAMIVKGRAGAKGVGTSRRSASTKGELGGSTTWQ